MRTKNPDWNPGLTSGSVGAATQLDTSINWLVAATESDTEVYPPEFDSDFVPDAPDLDDLPTIEDFSPAAQPQTITRPISPNGNGHKAPSIPDGLPNLEWLSSHCVSAADLVAEGSEPTVWLTESFLALGELVIVSGRPASQKSLIMLYWACCAVTGEAFLAQPNGLGGRRTRKSCVLWVNTDNSRADHKNRLIAILKNRKSADVPLFSITVTDFELKNTGHVKRLLEVADAYAADVIVLDTLSGCLAGVDENSAAAMTGPAANLRAMTEGNRTVIVIHHPPKNDPEGTRGSSVLGGKVDRALTVSREDGVVTVKSTKSGGYEYGDIVALSAIEADPATKTITSANFFDGAFAKQMAETQHAREAIRTALETGPMNIRALRTACKGIGAGSIGRAVKAMIADGLVSEKSGPRGARELNLCPAKSG
jgi:AAA domain